MTERGEVRGVSWVAQGSELSSLAAIGALALTVDNPVDFDEDGGTLDLNGAQLDYGTIDQDTGIITLDVALAAAGAAGDKVKVVSGGVVAIDYVAFVSLGDGDEVEVPIPYAQRDMWPEGEYPDPIVVDLSDDLEELIGVPGRTPVRDGSFIDPATAPTNAAVQAELDANAAALLVLDGEMNTAQTDITASQAAIVSLNALFPITTTSITPGAITTPTMTANAINGDRITVNTLDAAKIVAGSVTTDRMTANTINGDRISVNTLNADRIVANSITTGQLSATAIDGMTITGAIIQSAASGTRISINDGGTVNDQIRFYISAISGGGWGPGYIAAGGTSTTQGTITLTTPTTPFATLQRTAVFRSGTLAADTQADLSSFFETRVNSLRAFAGVQIGSSNIPVGSMSWQTTSVTTNASGDFTVTHQLGTTPSSVWISGQTAAFLVFRTTALAATTFTIRAYNVVTAAAHASSTFSVGWIALA